MQLLDVTTVVHLDVMDIAMEHVGQVVVIVVVPIVKMDAYMAVKLDVIEVAMVAVTMLQDNKLKKYC